MANNKLYTTILLALALLVTGSCRGLVTEDRSECFVDPGTPAKVHLTVKGKGLTKTSSVTNFAYDERITRAFVYVLNPSSSDSSVPGDVVDIYQYDFQSSPVTGEVNLDLIASVGQKFFYVVLNGNNAGTPANYTQLKALSMDIENDDDLFCDQRWDGPLMTGLSAKTSISSASTSVDITVTRRVFRVNVPYVVNDLPESYNLTLLYAYLSNYVSNYTYGNTSCGTVYYGNNRGRMGVGSGANNTSNVIDGVNRFSYCQYAHIRSSASVPRRGMSTIYNGHGLYSFPNHCSTDSWGKANASARKTRLVIVTNIGDMYGNNTIYYYPISLDYIPCNNTVDMTVVLHNLGTLDPEEELQKGTLSLTATVSDWSSSDYNFNF